MVGVTAAGALGAGGAGVTWTPTGAENLSGPGLIDACHAAYWARGIDGRNEFGKEANDVADREGALGAGPEG